MIVKLIIVQGAMDTLVEINGDRYEVERIVEAIKELHKGDIYTKIK